MKIPKPHETSYKICLKIFNHGNPVKLEEGVGLHGHTGISRMSVSKKNYLYMVKVGYFKMVGEKYYVADYLHKYFMQQKYLENEPEDKPKKVLPRYIPQRGEMKPVARDPRIPERRLYPAQCAPDPLGSILK